MSVKAVIKSLEQGISTGTLNEESINEYIDKVFPADASQAEWLNEDLVKLYNANTEDQRPPAILIVGITKLLGLLNQPGILENWFGSLVPYAVDSSGINNDLADACRDFIKKVFEAENEAISKQYIGWLVEIYVKKDMGGWITSPNVTMERRRFIRFNCRSILLEVFPKTVEASSEIINSYIVQRDHRLISLQLLSECVSKCDQSKLFKVHDHEIMESLYKCLENDQSSTSLSIAETTLAMILPHICDKLVPSLGRIYSCFGRLSSWDPVAESDLLSTPESDDQQETSGTSTPAAPSGGSSWEALPSSEEDQQPSTESLYMIIYGLFPNNTLEFCRDPNEYLKEAKFERSFNDFWNVPAIKRNAEQLFGVYLLHPGLLNSSKEQEIQTNATRWQSYRSTVHIIMQCVGLHAASVGHQHETEDQQLNSLLAEHLRLFKTNMAPSNIQRSRSSSRPPRSSRSPSVSRHNLLTSPALPPLPDDPQNGPQNGGANTPQSDDDSANRRRSKSQPPQPSELGALSMMAPPTIGLSTANTTVNSPALAPTSSSTTLMSAMPSEASEYFFRELLLCRNELDFSNFNRYILERRIVKIQKKVAMLEMGNIRVENLVQKNKQLVARISVLDQELVKSQKSARNLLNQRTSYESNILEKNKELKQKLRDQETLTSEQEEEKKRLQHQMQELQTLTDRRGALVSELELNVTRLTSKLEQLSVKRQEEDDTLKVEVNDDFDEGVAAKVEHNERVALESQLQRLHLEAEGTSHDYETQLSVLEKDKQRLQQLVNEQQQRIDQSSMLAQKYDTTRRKVAEIQARSAQQYESLRKAHEELLQRYSTTERELRARRVHDEERMNELRSTLATTQPFQSDSESRFEMKMRGGRGGVQKR